MDHAAGQRIIIQCDYLIGCDGPSSRIRQLIDAEEHRLGLDRPLASQYLHWLGGFVRGDWGESIVSHRSVSTEIRQRMWNTAQLAVWARPLCNCYGWRE